MTLAARALAFGYPGHPVGHDVSFELSAGEIVCLLGPNGGGKTTLFKTLLGLIAPLGGEVALDGAGIARLSRATIARAVGYVPQAQTGYFPFTVGDVVLMGRTAHLGAFAVPGAADRAAAAAALDRLGIGHLADRIYTQVSGGERQLALIARALAGGPKLLVMDEPTASLDFGNRTRVLAEIARLDPAARGQPGYREQPRQSRQPRTQPRQRPNHRHHRPTFNQVRPRGQGDCFALRLDVQTQQGARRRQRGRSSRRKPGTVECQPQRQQFEPACLSARIVADRESQAGIGQPGQTRNRSGIGPMTFREEQRKDRTAGMRLAVIPADDGTPRSQALLPCILWHYCAPLVESPRARPLQSGSSLPAPRTGRVQSPRSSARQVRGNDRARAPEPILRQEYPQPFALPG